MRYYVTADPHGFFTILRDALEAKGYFSDPGPRKLVILGDVMDRGPEAKEMQTFLLEQMEQDSLILIRGNHEDLFEKLATSDSGRPYAHHRHNGTYDTALQLTGRAPEWARKFHSSFASTLRSTPFYQKIIPASVDWYETEHYIFVHGWIPVNLEAGVYVYREDWREADDYAWGKARWLNGMELAPGCREKKTILCGHWHASFGHAVFERRGSEDGPDAIYTTYCGPGILALDACTVVSGMVNVEVLEDNP